MSIRVSEESARGCGYRKGGGLYLVADKPNLSCGKLPRGLERCPTCDHGIKPSRGWTWIDACELMSKVRCGARVPTEKAHRALCEICPLAEWNFQNLTKSGLLWIGEKYYATPEAYLNEARAMGLSRRIQSVPRGFEVGKTWVLLAHRKAVSSFMEAPGEGFMEVLVPGIFSVFQPTHVEYIVKGTETEEELSAKEARGLSLVKVIPV